MGADLQYLFGISGRALRATKTWHQIRNDAWITPSQDETPKGAHKVENACYW